MEMWPLATDGSASTMKALRSAGPTTTATMDGTHVACIGGCSNPPYRSPRTWARLSTANTTPLLPADVATTKESRESSTGLSKPLLFAGMIAVALGFSHSMLLKQDGSVWTTGVNKYGQLGQDTRRSSRVFTQAFPSGAKAIAAGHSHSMVLTQDGSVWTVGQNTYGQLGDGSSSSTKISFVKIISGGAKAVAAGGYHSMVLREDGGVWAAGWNRYGQLGEKSIANSYWTKFTQVFSSGAKTLGAGEMHSMILNQDGSVWATGRNSNGQLGDGSTTDRSSFVEVMSSGAEAVSAGGCHSMVLKQDGSVWATGGNSYGQLGDGSLADKATYVQVFFSFTRTKAIAAGGRHSMVLKQDGSVWVTGRNYHGQLGDGSETNRRYFIQVFVSGVKAIAAGSEHSMVVAQDGSVWATGTNIRGQSGHVSTTSEKTFRVVRIANGGAVHNGVLPDT